MSGWGGIPTITQLLYRILEKMLKLLQMLKFINFFHFIILHNKYIDNFLGDCRCSSPLGMPKVEFRLGCATKKIIKFLIDSIFSFI